MQYVVLLLVVLMMLVVAIIMLYAISYFAVQVNNVSAMEYTMFDNSTYMSGTYVVNGTTIKQVSTTPSNKLIIEVYQGSSVMISNGSWSEWLSDNGVNGPIYTPYAQFNLSAGYYRIAVPKFQSVQQSVYSTLYNYSYFIMIVAITMVVAVLMYSRQR